MNISRTRLVKTVAVVLSISLVACTIVREPDNDDENDGNDAGFDDVEELIYNDIPVDATIVDAVVFIEVSNASSGLADGYHSYISEVEAALVQQHTYIRDLAVAPMYRQQGQQVPLLYGRGAPNNLRSSMAGTLEYYLTDDGRDHLDEPVDSPAENPARLGENLAGETIYNPETGSGDGSSYFRQPEDGFVAFHITGSARECGHDDSSCSVDGQPPADHFTETDDGDATWLQLAGSQLSPDDIIHVSVATDEGVDYDSFADACTSRPDFPNTYLDFLEPSEDHEYYRDFIAGLDDRGGHGHSTDLCDALSGQFDSSAASTASAIVDAVR